MVKKYIINAQTKLGKTRGDAPLKAVVLSKQEAQNIARECRAKRVYTRVWIEVFVMEAQP